MSEVRLPAPVKATLVEGDLVAEGKEHPAGAFRLYENAGIKYLHFLCPCGCGGLWGVSFAPSRWTFDGNSEAPTVTPSIRAFEPSGDGTETHWHGCLTAGEWRQA